MHTKLIAPILRVLTIQVFTIPAFAMRVLTVRLITIQILFVVCFSLPVINNVHGAGRFKSNYPCRDQTKTCRDYNSRIVSGVYVDYPDCWEYSYAKTCDYPSKNNCSQYDHCYLVAFRECLLKDSINNCVNQMKEFSCKRWETRYINKDKVRYGLEDREGEEQLICKGIPCIDGNCIDKRFDSNNEMLDSVSRLSAISQMKEAGEPNTQLFAGYHAHCSKKAVDYSNCCSLTSNNNNWGHNLGARCSQDEKHLIEQRKKNLCVYLGKVNKQTLGVNTVVKHNWCCFGNMLNKVIQVEGRKQLSMSFGTAKSPNCRGLTLDELLKLDFDRMDFAEFEAEILKTMKLPNKGDIKARIENSISNIQKPQDERTASENGHDGVNTNLVDELEGE